MIPPVTIERQLADMDGRRAPWGRTARGASVHVSERLRSQLRGNRMAGHSACALPVSREGGRPTDPASPANAHTTEGTGSSPQMRASALR